MLKGEAHPPSPRIFAERWQGKWIILGSTLNMCFFSVSVLWTKHSTGQKWKCHIFLRMPFQVYLDGGGNVLWIKVTFIQKHHALSYRAAEKNCIRAQGTLFQTSAGLARPIYSSTASISPGCFGASWVVETINDQVDRYWQLDTKIQ